MVITLDQVLNSTMNIVIAFSSGCTGVSRG